MENIYDIICERCGKIHHPMNYGDVILNNEKYCEHCVPKTYKDKPYFTRHIPSFVSGADIKIFNFENIEELINKAYPKKYGKCIYCTSGNMLMVQSIKESYWWVLGYISNYDIGKDNLPKFDSNLYDENGKPNEQLVES